MRDVLGSVALGVLVVLGWTAACESFDVVAGLAVIALLVGPFLIFGSSFLRFLKDEELRIRARGERHRRR